MTRSLQYGCFIALDSICLDKHRMQLVKTSKNRYPSYMMMKPL